MNYTTDSENEISEIVRNHLTRPASTEEMLSHIQKLLEEYKNDHWTLSAIWDILIKHDVSKNPTKYFYELFKKVCEESKKDE